MSGKLFLLLKLDSTPLNQVKVKKKIYLGFHRFGSFQNNFGRNPNKEGFYLNKIQHKIQLGN
jgi:hypothetical protein